jgi:hypothetical protein
MFGKYEATPNACLARVDIIDNGVDAGTSKICESVRRSSDFPRRENHPVGWHSILRGRKWQ